MFCPGCAIRELIVSTKVLPRELLCFHRKEPGRKWLRHSGMSLPALWILRSPCAADKERMPQHQSAPVREECVEPVTQERGRRRRPEKSQKNSASSSRGRKTVNDRQRPSRDDSPDDLDASEPENDDSTGGDAGRKKWRWWEIIVLLEAKRDEAVERSSAPVRGIVLRAVDQWNRIATKCKSKGVNYDGPQCQGKWNVLVREYRKIIDHNAPSGQQPWESMTPDERKEANLPITFETKHLRILDSFMKDRAGQNPGSIADSSINLESNVDSDEPTGKEEKLNDKRKRPMGENTRFMVCEKV
ncbi:hypothetical protein R1sor_020981 [Riccia sorocarpa]|uniref:Myb/SANT-like DNA-binding domain-containing protein n=1 Tax=Riccia sorocarpa TaxID=122646 RepID=A0ABD3GJ36_9MARC